MTPEAERLQAPLGAGAHRAAREKAVLPAWVPAAPVELAEPEGWRRPVARVRLLRHHRHRLALVEWRAWVALEDLEDLGALPEWQALVGQAAMAEVQA